jgi:plastocyanin
METISSAPASKGSRMSPPPSPEYRRQGIDHRERADVQNLRAAIEHEKRDARVTIKPFSLWALVVCGVTIFFVGFCSARYHVTFTATTRDSGNPPTSRSTLQTVQAEASSGTAVHDTVANANAPRVVHVVMKNMKFNPPSVEVKSGDVVEWKNEDITPHTATSAALFDSGSIDSDKSWRHTFTEQGDFPYGCTFHPEMKAVVTVK